METPSLARIRRIGFQTIVRREYGRIIRIWGQTLVPPAVTAALYFVIFGSLIGRRIGQMDGFSYMQYIAPGLIMMAVISNSYGNVVSSFFGAKFGKHIEELLVAPLPNWLIVAGYVAGGLMRGLLVGAVVTLVTLFFTHVPVAHPFLIVGSVFLTATVFSLGGLFNAIFAKNFDQISWFPTFILTPAHLPRRRVLLGLAAAALGREALVREPDPLHGQRVPPRLPRHQRRGSRPRLRDHGSVRGRDVHDRRRAHEPRHRDPRVGNGPCAAAMRSSPRPRPSSASSRSTTSPNSSRATTSRRRRTVPAVRTGEEGARAFAMLHWGLVPKWAKERAIGNRMINARSETLAEKPSFREAFKKRRCLVLADGWYEWQVAAGGKQPWFIRRKDARPFAFAGLWERWKDPADGSTLESCTIVTTDAAESIRKIHERMPVVLEETDWDRWTGHGLLGHRDAVGAPEALRSEDARGLAGQPRGQCPEEPGSRR